MLRLVPVGLGLASDMALLKSESSLVAKSLLSGWNMAASLSVAFVCEDLVWMSSLNACALFAYKGG